MSWGNSSLQAGHLVGKFEGVAEAEEVAPETEFDLKVDAEDPETEFWLSSPERIAIFLFLISLTESEPKSGPEIEIPE